LLCGGLDEATACVVTITVTANRQVPNQTLMGSRSFLASGFAKATTGNCSTVAH
jgi:hypothetical protein